MFFCSYYSRKFSQIEVEVEYFWCSCLISPRLDARIGVELYSYCALAARLRMAISPENFFI